MRARGPVAGTIYDVLVTTENPAPSHGAIMGRVSQIGALRSPPPPPSSYPFRDAQAETPRHSQVVLLTPMVMSTRLLNSLGLFAERVVPQV